MANRRPIWIAAIAALVWICLAPLLGPSHVDYGRAAAGLAPDRQILFDVRIPRVLLAALAGGTLAVCGLLFQGILRDALATPYTLGVSSGASLGAVISIVAGWQQAAGLPAIWIAAFLGALATLSIVLMVAVDRRRLSSFTLLLAGVTLNSMCLALILFLQSVTSMGRSMIVTRWLMGSIDVVDFQATGWLALLSLPLYAWLHWHAREWNLLAVGEDWAEARGVPTQQLLRRAYLCGSLLTAAVTALTGPIGFVGLIVPHALRLRLGADHRTLLPCCLLYGAAFLVLCDTVARTAFNPIEIPVGVVTALAGGPFFIWLLRSKRRSLWM